MYVHYVYVHLSDDIFDISNDIHHIPDDILHIPDDIFDISSGIHGVPDDVLDIPDIVSTFLMMFLAFLIRSQIFPIIYLIFLNKSWMILMVSLMSLITLLTLVMMSLVVLIILWMFLMVPFMFLAKMSSRTSFGTLMMSSETPKTPSGRSRISQGTCIM